MTDRELVRCSEAVIDFLVNCEEEYERLGRFDTPSNERMLTQLGKYDIRMIDIPVILNRKLHIQSEPLWIHSPKEFFSDHDKSVSFLTKSIKILTRKDKLLKLKDKI